MTALAINTEIDANVAAFANAYVLGNKAAQMEDATSPEFKGAFQIATEAGYVRDGLEWNAAVAGAAAFYFNGHRF